MFSSIDPFIIDTVIPTLTHGLLVTLALILPSACIGSIFGICLGVVRAFGNPWTQKIANTFVHIFRGIPLAVQLMIIYFGLPSFGILLDPYPTAVLTFTLCTGAYQSEYIRSALLSIQQGQLKAAFSLGFKPIQAILYIIIPQATRRALPGCGNELIYLIKYSSLAYLVTCIELTGEAKLLVAQTFKPTEIYFLTGVYYLCLVSVASWGIKKLEKTFSIQGT